MFVHNKMGSSSAATSFGVKLNYIFTMYMVSFGYKQVSSVGTATIHVILCGYAVDVCLYRCVLIKRVPHA